MPGQIDPKLLKEAIIKTIVFFDVLNYPLTVFEIWKHLFGKFPAGVALFEVQKLIDAGIAGLEEKNSFYFLPGREALVERRRASRNLAEEKMNKALRVIRWLRFVPGMEMAAVCNSLAIGNIREESDIDLFIITARRRIWLTRFLVTLIVQGLGLRRHGRQVQDKICLSFYVADDKLDLENVALDNDPYFYYWLATLIPVYDDNCFGRFRAKNSWLRSYLPDYFPVLPGADKRVGDNAASRALKRAYRLLVDPLIGNILERAARFIQLKKMEKNTASLAGKNDSRVVISDSMLKFHEMDRREEYLRQWGDKLGKLRT